MSETGVSSLINSIATFVVVVLLNYLFAAPALANLLFGDASANRELIWAVGSINAVWAGVVSFFTEEKHIHISQPAVFKNINILLSLLSDFLAIDTFPFFVSGFYLSHYLRSPFLLIILTCFLPPIFSECTVNLIQTVLFTAVFFVVTTVTHAQQDEDITIYAMPWNGFQVFCFFIVQGLLPFYSHHNVLVPAKQYLGSTLSTAATHAAAVFFAVTVWAQFGLPSSLRYDSNPFFLLPAFLAIWNLLSFSYDSEKQSDSSLPLEQFLLCSTSASAAGALLPSCVEWELIVVPILWFSLTKTYLSKIDS
jgi:hypothetical protein